MTSSRADAAIARARALVGARFVPHGRVPEEGLDCVGLAAAALGLALPPARYALRCGGMAVLTPQLRAAGLTEVRASAPGDVLVLAAGPGQLHLGIWTGGSLVHADAGLRRVVERPAPLPWPLVGAWRLPEEEEPTWRR